MTKISVAEASQKLRPGDNAHVEGVLLVDSYNCAFLGESSRSYEDGSLIRLKSYDKAIEKVMAHCGACVGGPLTIQLPATIEGRLEEYEMFGSGRVLVVESIEFEDLTGITHRVTN